MAFAEKREPQSVDPRVGEVKTVARGDVRTRQEARRAAASDRNSALATLPARVHREAVDHPYGAGHLELRQPLAEVADEALHVDRPPGTGTTNAPGTSPSRASGSPMTAACATEGCSRRTRSTSAGYTLKPPTTTMSFNRSTMRRLPSSPIHPTSPVANHSPAWWPLVASGHRDTRHEPIPARRSRPGTRRERDTDSSTIRTSTPSIGRPEVSATTSMGSPGRVMVQTPVVSVRP